MATTSNMYDMGNQTSENARQNLQQYNSKPYSYLGFGKQMIDFFSSVPDKIIEAKELDSRIRKNQIKGEEIYDAYSDMVSKMVSDEELSGKLAELYGLNPEDKQAIQLRALSSFSKFEPNSDAQKYMAKIVPEFHSFLEQIGGVGIDQQTVATLGMSNPTSNLRSGSEVERSNQIKNIQGERQFDDAMTTGPQRQLNEEGEPIGPTEYSTEEMKTLGTRFGVDYTKDKRYTTQKKNEVAREANKIIVGNPILTKNFTSMTNFYQKARSDEGLDGSGPLSEDVISEVAKQWQARYVADVNALAVVQAKTDAEQKIAEQKADLAYKDARADLEELKLARKKEEIPENLTANTYLAEVEKHDAEIAKLEGKEPTDAITAQIKKLRSSRDLWEAKMYIAKQDGGVSKNKTKVDVMIDSETVEYALLGVKQLIANKATSKEIEQAITDAKYEVISQSGGVGDITYSIAMTNIAHPLYKNVYLFNSRTGKITSSGNRSKLASPFGEGKDPFAQDSTRMQLPASKDPRTYQ